MQFIKEIIEILFTVIYEFGKTILVMLWEIFIINLPTTKYGLIQYFVENNLIIFNSQLLTNIILYIVPLFVSHIIVHLPLLKKRGNIAIKEIVSIILYLVFLLLFSTIICWIIIGVILIILLYLSIKSFDDDGID